MSAADKASARSPSMFYLTMRRQARINHKEKAARAAYDKRKKPATEQMECTSGEQQQKGIQDCPQCCRSQVV